MGGGWRGGGGGGGRGRGGGGGRRGGGGGGGGGRYRGRNRDCDTSDTRSMSSYGSYEDRRAPRGRTPPIGTRRDRSPYSADSDRDGAPRHQKQPRLEDYGRGGYQGKRDMPSRGGYERGGYRGGYERGGRGGGYDRGGYHDRGGHQQQRHPHYHQSSTTVNSSRPEPIPEDLPEEHCLRVGIRDSKYPVTKDQVLQEVDRVGYGHKIIRCILEEKDLVHPNVEWSRVYFSNEEEAEQCLAQLLFPGRMWQSGEWSNVVTQLLPVPGPYCGDVGGGAFEAFPLEPADCVCIEAQGGEIVISTDYLYKTKGLIEYYNSKVDAKKALRRVICKHFDPEKKNVCRFGTECNFLHLKAIAMTKLIRTVPHQREVRLASGRVDSLQISSWEYDRRQDTLLVRDMEELDLDGLKYMFATCEGFKECWIRTTSLEVKPKIGPRGHTIGDSRNAGTTKYGIVRFDSNIKATSALLQTFDSGLNISLWGVLEDVRLMQLREAKADPRYAHELARRMRAAAGPPAYHHNHHSPGGRHSGGDRHTTDDKRRDESADGRKEDNPTNATGGARKENNDNNNDSKKENGGDGDGGGDADANAESSSEGVPFPELPDGWLYGVSRKQDKFYFYQQNAKGKTTWKHPTTNEVYSR